MVLNRYLLALCLLSSGLSIAAELQQVTVVNAADQSRYQTCVLRLIETSTDRRAETIKDQCRAESRALKEVVAASPLDVRIQDESETMLADFVLTPHKPNYILPISYNQNPNDILARESGDERLALDSNEVQFQVSLKVPVASNIFATEWDIYGAYTGRSFWQAYNNEASSPFRDTNHEPEAWLSRPLEFQWGGLSAKALRLGFVHQSNGRSQLLSRSWNRVYADFIFQVDDLSFSFKPWYRIDEDEKSDRNDPSGDDNPDIEDYMGKFELLSAYKVGQHTFSLMLRNNLKSDNYGAADLSWSFPINDKMKGYVKYFNGYGETLLDYNHRSNRLSVGFVVADWL